MSPFMTMSKRLSFSMPLAVRSHRLRAHKRRFLPWVDVMEDRTLLSTLVVMNDHDSGSGSLAPRSARLIAGTPSRFPQLSKARPSRSPPASWR